MDNIYLVYGNDDYLIDDKIKEIKSKYKDYDYIKYDMTVDDVSMVIDDYTMGSLFGSDKLIVCKNCLFLSGEKCDMQVDVDSLLKVISLKSNNVIIFSVYHEVDKRKKIVKELLKNSFCCTNLSGDDIIKFVNKYLKNSNILMKKSTLDVFLEKLNYKNYLSTNQDDEIKLFKRSFLYLVISELDKLFITCDKEITVDDVNNNVMRIANSDIFELIDAIIKRDRSRIFILYDDFLLKSGEELALLVMLSNQFRLSYQAKCMYRDGMSEREIAEYLEIHPYRVKLARSLEVSCDDLLRYLKDLACLDEDIKMGKVDKKDGFMKFLMKV